MDAFPVISQVKSLIQAISGDLDGAEQTQINFSQQCPVVSQIRSAVEASCGDCEAAEQTQIEQLKWLNGLANGIPAVGHLKGVVHDVAGDVEGGNQAMEASSRSTAVVGGAILGGLAGGAGGAVGAAVCAGALVDGTATAIDSSIEGKFKGHGTMKAIGDACEAKGKEKAGHVFDAIVGVAGDAVTGFIVGKTVQASSYAKKPVSSKIAQDTKLMRCEKKGAAPVYAHDKPTTFTMNQQVLPSIAEANPGKQIHVATGMHGEWAQNWNTCDMAPKGFAEPKFYADYHASAAAKPKWGAGGNAAKPNMVVYDMGKPAHKAAFQAAMKKPSANVMYIDWCHGTQNPALNPNPATMGKVAAVATADQVTKVLRQSEAK